MLTCKRLENTKKMNQELTGRPLSKMAFSTIDEMFRQTAQTHGPQPALITQHGSSLTYTQLDSLSTKLAEKITSFVQDKVREDTITNGVGPVLLAMSPCPERIIAILALWKIKNTYYVPIESCVPKNRIKLIVREIKPTFVLTCGGMYGKLSLQEIYAEGVNFITTFNKVMEYEPINKSTSLESNTVSSDRDACVLYTSGSTGTPKGVVLTHGNILSRLTWQWNQFPFDENAVGIAKTSLLFVDSITEIWSFVLKGKPIVVMNEKLRDVEVLVKTMNDFNVSRIVLVPSLLQSILYYCKMTSFSLPKLHEVVCSGERLPIETAHNFFKIFGGKTLLNFYGSTEVTGDATFAVFRNLDDLNEQLVDGNIPIGIPIDGVRVKLVTERDEAEVENPLTGQIVVEGPTVMKKYFGSSETWTQYHTGDFGRIHNGRLYFVGRKDDQTKIRGNRVNCSEIQAILRKGLGVNAVVMVTNADTSQAEIVAFVEGDADIKQRALDLCKETLPDYMVPSAFVSLESIPLTDATRKIDRQMLLHLYQESRQVSSVANTVPDNELTKFLTTLSEEVGMNVLTIRLDHEFYMLGGNSVNKVRLASTLQDQGYDFVFSDFMVAKTVKNMYDVVRNQSQSQTETVHDRYEILPLEREEHPPQNVLHLLLDSFLLKDPLTILCKYDVDGLHKLAQLAWYAAMETNSSFVIKERSTGEYVAAFVGIDVGPMDFDGFNPGVLLHLEVLHVADQVFDPIPEGEKVMDVFTLTTIRRMTAEDNLELIRLAEEHIIKVCRQRGYYAVRAQNTNPATQHICKQLGYIEKGSFALKDYTREDGTKPFYDIAPPDTTIRAHIMYLK